MSAKLVIKSIERFFKDNIPSETIFITTDSAKADVFSFDVLNYNPLNTNPVDTQLSGTVVSFIGGVLTGNLTTFVTDFAVGDPIKINDEIRIVGQIDSDTSLWTDEDFTGIVGGEDIFIPSGTEMVLQDTGGDPLDTDEDLSGWVISYNGEDRAIVSYDNTTSIAVIDSPFSDPINSGETMTISRLTWAFIKSSYLIDGKGCNSNREQLMRIYIYVKTKQDSSKLDMYDLIDLFNEAIKTNYSNFPIYDGDNVTILANGKFESTVRAMEVIEEDKSLQSYMINFQVSFYKKYK